MRVQTLCRAVLAMLLSSAAASTLHAQSLYNEASFQALTADRKAHAVGDALTVMIQENASANSASDTVTGRKHGVDAHIDSPFHLFGTAHWVGTHELGIGTGADFSGSGQTQRSGQVLAQITLTVRAVLPNGMLVVAGEQTVDINNEKQRITVEGSVRPQDISDTNSVASFHLADAKISYQGLGDITETQRPSWWHRLLTAFAL